MSDAELPPSQRIPRHRFAFGSTRVDEGPIGAGFISEDVVGRN
jgi:hypothetical protein